MDRDSPWSTSTPSHLPSDQPAAAALSGPRHAAVASSSNPSTAATTQTPHRDLPPSSASAAPPALPATFNPAAAGSSAKYDAYGTPSIASRTANLSLSTPAGSGTHTPRDNTMAYTHNGDLDGDMTMEDADPYNKQKSTLR